MSAEPDIYLNATLISNKPTCTFQSKPYHRTITNIVVGNGVSGAVSVYRGQLGSVPVATNPVGGNNTLSGKIAVPAGQQFWVVWDNAASNVSSAFARVSSERLDNPLDDVSSVGTNWSVNAVDSLILGDPTGSHITLDSTKSEIDIKPATALTAGTITVGTDPINGGDSMVLTSPTYHAGNSAAVLAMGSGTPASSGDLKGYVNVSTDSMWIKAKATGVTVETDNAFLVTKFNPVLPGYVGQMWVDANGTHSLNGFLRDTTPGQIRIYEGIAQQVAGVQNISTLSGTLINGCQLQVTAGGGGTPVIGPGIAAFWTVSITADVTQILSNTSVSIIELYVDGIAQPAQALYQGPNFGRATVFQQFDGSFAADSGTHTFEMRSSASTTINSSRTTGIHTRMKLEVWA